MLARYASTCALIILPACGAFAQTQAEVGLQSADQAEAAPSYQDVVVTGSRITSQAFNAPTPVTTIDADRIQKLGVPTVGETLAQLPSFRASASPTTTGTGSNTSPVNAGGRTADLRGLGPQRTLVLVDGRRFVPSTAQGTVDLNLIPALLVQRAEVVTGGASAAYGSDAVSGVVNILLNKTMTGIRGSAQYGVTDKGDGKDYLLQFAGGIESRNGRGNLVFAFEYEQDEGVGSCYTRNFCGNEIATLTGRAGLDGRPANNIATDLRPATSSPGGLITATIDAAGLRTAATAGPLKGIQFADDGTPTEFIYGLYPNAVFQQGGSGRGQNVLLGTPLISMPVTRYNAYTHGQYEFSDAFTGFIDASYGSVTGYARAPEVRELGFPSAGITVHAENPYLPQSIRTTMEDNDIAALTIGRLGIDFGNAMGISRKDTYRIVAGGHGTLSGSWKWDAYAQYGKTDYDQTVSNNRINANFAKAVDVIMGDGGTPICRVNGDTDLTNDDPNCQPLNIIGQNQFSDAAKAYSFGMARQQMEFQQTVYAANLQGDLFNTWAGVVPIAVGVELRQEKVVANVDPISAASGFYVFNSQNAFGRSRVIEGYAETSIPLLDQSAFGESLVLNGAVRRAYYRSENADVTNDFSATTWKLGAVYRPVEGVMFRVTKSQDIRAPNSAELFTSPVGGLAIINDTQESFNGLTDLFTGGNINLLPETADTLTAGVTFQPSAVPGLRISADVYRIEISGAITTLAPQMLVDRCNTTGAPEVCSLITRSPTTNLIDSISVGSLNLNKIAQEGLDVELGYRIPLQSVMNDGSLDLRLLANKTFKSSTTDSTGTTIDRAGDNGPNGIPDWRVDGMATLNFGRGNVSIRGNYLSAGKVDATLIGPEDEGYSVTLPNSINTNRVPSRFYTTIAASFDLMRSESSSLELFGSVVNLFDVDPPARFSNNGNAVYYDNIGRRYRIGLRFTH